MLDPAATMLRALLTLSLQRAEEGGGEERQALSQKWQYLFKVTSYSHAAESVPVNHTNSHRGWLLLRQDSWEQEKPTAACALLLLRYTLSFRPRPQ